MTLIQDEAFWCTHEGDDFGASDWIGGGGAEQREAHSKQRHPRIARLDPAGWGEGVCGEEALSWGTADAAGGHARTLPPRAPTLPEAGQIGQISLSAGGIIAGKARTSADAIGQRPRPRTDARRALVRVPRTGLVAAAFGAASIRT